MMSFIIWYFSTIPYLNQLAKHTLLNCRIEPNWLPYSDKVYNVKFAKLHNFKFLSSPSLSIDIFPFLSIVSNTSIILLHLFYVIPFLIHAPYLHFSIQISLIIVTPTSYALSRKLKITISSPPGMWIGHIGVNEGIFRSKIVFSIYIFELRCKSSSVKISCWNENNWWHEG